MVIVVSEEHVHETMEELMTAGETVYNVGSVIERGEGCVLKNLDSWDSECGHSALTCTDSQDSCQQ